MPTNRIIQILNSALLILTLAGCGGDDAAKWARIDGEEPQLSKSASTPAGGATGRNRMAPHANMGPAGASGFPGAASRNVSQVGNKLTAAGIEFTLADGWAKENPSSQMRLAQYRLPGPGGDAQLAVFYFGPGQGGNIQDNVARWTKQFTGDKNSTDTTEADVATLEQDNLKLSLVKTAGTYNPGQMGMGGPAAEPKPDYALFGIVVEGGSEGSVFVKTTGPKKTLDAQNPALEAFARSIRKAK